MAGLLISATLTAVLTGITEPIEFSFLFAAPLLYGVHCILAGSAFMLMHIFQVGVGQTFSGSLIDFILFGVMQGNAKTNWIYVIIVGIFYFPIYYFLFKALIKKFNFKTPGREDDEEETKLYTRKDVEASKKNKSKNSTELSQNIEVGLGGKDNVVDVDCCATRLRITVKEIEKVDEKLLKSTGAKGVLKVGNGVQVIYGPHVNKIKTDFEKYLETV